MMTTRVSSADKRNRKVKSKATRSSQLEDLKKKDICSQVAGREVI
jgi:hypothetical protein